MPRRIDLVEGGRTHSADLDEGRVTVGDQTFDVSPLGAGQWRLLSGGRAERAWTATRGDTVWVFREGRVHVFERDPGGWRGPATSGPAALTAPMPASVRQVLVQAGQAVRAGEVLVLLEAMKMELPIRAAVDGVVRQIHCRPGDLVQPGVPLLDVEPS